MERTILHIDMDAFFASIEQRDRDLAGKPVIVGADPKKGKGRGVVSAASYEARKYGIHSAQPISQAYRMCPMGIFLPVRMERYAEVSRIIIDIFHEYTPVVEVISLDEAFLDMTGTSRMAGDIESLAMQIKRHIYHKERLVASIGIGPNKLIAKIASDLKKPNGLVHVSQEKVHDFLAPLPVIRLWGIGKKTAAILAEVSIHTIGQLEAAGRTFLTGLFGEHTGEALWKRACGIDESPVIPSSDARSISNEITFSSDTSDTTVHLNTILSLSEKVGYRLREQHLCAKTVVLKIRFSDFSTFSRQCTLRLHTSLSETIFHSAKKMYSHVPIRLPVRLLGVGVSHLSGDGSMQTDLFITTSEKRLKASEAVDALKQKFGDHIITKGNVTF